MAEVDQQLKQAFGELQQKMIATRKQLIQNDAQVEYNKAVIRKSELTRKELSDLPPETETYRAVGRMFIVQTMPKAIDELTKTITTGKETIAQAEKNRGYLETSLKSEQDNIREMIHQSKQGKS